MFRVTNFKYLLIAFIYQEPRVLEKKLSNMEAEISEFSAPIYDLFYLSCVSLTEELL